MFIKILFYSGIIIWLIPPIRQYKNKFFFYFLILGLLDPLNLIYRLLFNQTWSTGVLILFSYGLLVSLLDSKTWEKKTFIILIPGLYLALLPVFILLSQSESLFVFVLLHFVILSIMLKRFIVYFIENNKLKIFLLVLVLYELTIIFKYLNLLIGFADATTFFVLTSIAQIGFGLYFSIVREDGHQNTAKL